MTYVEWLPTVADEGKRAYEQLKKSRKNKKNSE